MNAAAVQADLIGGSATAAPKVLELKGVSVNFGGVRALQGVSLALPASTGISAIIGPNGAGKTTLFNVVSGLVTPREGRILLGGRDVTGNPPDAIYRAGLSRTFQGVRLFANLNVIQNVLLAAASVSDRAQSATRSAESSQERAAAALRQVGIEERFWKRFPSGLTVVQSKFVEIARALSSRPAVLLLDEPGAGLNSAEKILLSDRLRAIAEDYRCRVVLVEHDMKLVMSVSESIWVMNFGTLLAHGNPAEIQANPAVIEAYLGQADD